MPTTTSQAPAATDNRTLLEAYSFFFNHLVDFAGTDLFGEYTPEYRREFLHDYRKFAESVFDHYLLKSIANHEYL